MISALSGFAVIAVIVLIGWTAGRWAHLPPSTVPVIGRLAYVVLSPCLLFTSASASDPRVLFSEPLLVSALAACTCFALHALITRRHSVDAGSGPRIIGALAAGYNNAGNIGIPIAAYVLHDPALAVPIVILQLLVITPIALTLLELATTGHNSWRTSLTAPLRSPLTVSVLLGVVVAVTGLHLPSVITTPIDAIGQSAVPVVLIAFGMSLSGGRVLAPGPDRLPTLAAVVLKVALMPAVAYLLAQALHLSPTETYAVTVLAALPAAQNVFLYAQTFNTAVTLARDAVFLSTLLCVPILLTIAVVAAP
ncbi:AEC family transporter [Actinoplanes sp. NPDC049596]|uniref:AEC family transporter n=1 Tax=unclassified Actinoplanes TaxID=2626549 RepID=UPI003421CEFD